MTPLDDELRRTLDGRASRVPPPSDPLAGIESRARGIQRRRQAVAGGGAAAAVLLLAIAVPLAIRGDDKRPQPPALQGPTVAATTLPASPAPTLAPSPAATPPVAPTAATTPPPASATPAPGPAAKAIYYLGDGGDKFVLYREFRRLPQATPDDVLRTMMTSPALDPDYESLWPKGSEATVGQRSGDVLTVELSDAALRGKAGGEAACLSLQQLVWTATAAVPDAKRIRLTNNGSAKGVVSQWWGVGCGKDEPVARHSPSFEVLAAVQISNRNEGDRVKAQFTFGGEAAVFEATVSWAVVDKATGAVLEEGFSTADAGAPARGTWQASVSLTGVKAGQRLELRAWETSAEDGSVTHLDTKTVIVG